MDENTEKKKTTTTRPIPAFFIFFISVFLQKYIFDLEIYRNIPRPPRCRAARTWSPRCGAAGLFCKNFRGEFALKPLNDRSPDSGAAGPPGRPAAGRQAPAARQRGDRLPETTGPRLLHQKFRKKFSVCRNTIHITYNCLTVHCYCKSVLALQGNINEV